MLFGLRINKAKNGSLEYEPFAMPVGEFTVKSYLESLTRNKDVSHNDKGRVVQILNYVIAADGDKDKFIQYMNEGIN